MSARRWIHCGLCNDLMTNRETKFYHLSCADILCRSCMGKTNRGTSCPVCNGTLRHFTELGNGMGRREKLLYHPSPVGFYQAASQTLTFQQKHRKHLVQAILKARDSLRRLDELEAQIRQTIVATQKRYENMRRFRRSLQESMRNTVNSCEGRTTAAASVCANAAAGRVTQRRISTDAPSVRSLVTLAPSQRRCSVDAFNLLNSVQMSQISVSNDSGIGLTPSTGGSFVGCGSSMPKTSTPKLMTPFRPCAVSQRRMSVGLSALPMNFTPFKAPRRYSTDTFNQRIPEQSSHGSNSVANTGDTLASSLFIRPKATTTTVSEFYANNNK